MNLALATANADRAFLNALQKAAPSHIQTILIDNGSELTDRLFNKQNQPSGEHEFNLLCAELGIECRLTKARSPQTNGAAERFNGWISDVLATHHFESGADLADTLELYSAALQPAFTAIGATASDTDSGHVDCPGSCRQSCPKAHCY